MGICHWHCKIQSCLKNQILFKLKDLWRISVCLSTCFWSNGPETSMPTSDNKQCMAKDHVVAAACLLVAEIYDRYDAFECDEVRAIVKVEKKNVMFTSRVSCSVLLIIV